MMFFVFALVTLVVGCGKKTDFPTAPKASTFDTGGDQYFVQYIVDGGGVASVTYTKSVEGTDYGTYMPYYNLSEAVTSVSLPATISCGTVQSGGTVTFSASGYGPMSVVVARSQSSNSYNYAETVTLVSKTGTDTLEKVTATLP